MKDFVLNVKQLLRDVEEYRTKPDLLKRILHEFQDDNVEILEELE
jgi:hypothetical protein